MATCSLLMAEPSLLKYSSLAAAVIWEERAFRRTTFLLLANGQDDMEAKDDNLFEEAESLILSMLQVLGAAKDPTEDMPAKVDAIYSSET